MEQQPLFDLTQYLDSQDPEGHDQDMLSVYLGEENAAAVVAALGGLTIRVPSNANGEQFAFLEQALGRELALLMVEKFGAEILYISQRNYSDMVKKHQAVKARFVDLQKQGQKRTSAIRTLVAETGWSERHIRRILSGHYRH